MKKLFKQAITVMLSFSMLIGLIPNSIVEAKESTAWKCLQDAVTYDSEEFLRTEYLDVIKGDGVIRVNLSKDIEYDPAKDNGCINIASGKTVLLITDKHTINRNLQDEIEDGYVFHIENGGSLYIFNCASPTVGEDVGCIKGGNNNGNGGAIYNEGYTEIGFWTNLCDNKAKNGGAIYNKGTLIVGSSFMENNIADEKGGTIYNEGYIEGTIKISDSNAKNGGAIYQASNGRTEVFLNSLITNCKATNDGGAFYIENGGTCTYDSATIKDCEAVNGGAICNDGAIGLKDTNICDNISTGHGNGVFLASNATMFIGGNLKINQNGNENVYLSDGAMIKFGTGEDVPAPTSSMKVGITTETVPTATTAVSIVNSASEDYINYISSDIAKYEVEFDSSTNKLQLIEKIIPVTHTAKKYKANDTKDTAEKISGTGKKGSTRTITPIEGKKVASVIVTDQEGNKIDVTQNEDGTYSFKQPASNVDVQVIYKNREIKLNIGSTKAEVDGEKETLDVAPIIRNDRTMLPIRFIAENLGAKVEWNELEPNMVYITRGDIKIEIKLGSEIMKVNDKEVILDQVAFAENDRTYLPVRAVSEALNAIVEWNEERQEVKIIEQ
ncbi:MAG: copper amine oxidase N-terminal domain-containing protein [Clostridia bacterium]|nr:copper amine oxidase N-terminal domain-containing protein [Clostridia bacterium]